MNVFERFTDGLDSTIHSLHNPTAITIIDGLSFFKLIGEHQYDLLTNLWKAIKGLHDFVIGVVYIAGLIYGEE